MRKLNLYAFRLFTLSGTIVFITLFCAVANAKTSGPITDSLIFKNYYLFSVIHIGTLFKICQIVFVISTFVFVSSLVKWLSRENALVLIKKH